MQVGYQSPMPRKRYYIVPVHFTYVTAAALLLSLFLNTISILAHLKGDLPYGVGISGSYHATGSSRISGEIQQALKPRSAALEVVDSDRYGMEDSNDWASITPPGHGFVKIDNEFYALSIYHQIHCLNSFRRMLNKSPNASYTEHDSMHSHHCLSYLRQMILCGADTTLEPAFQAINTDGRQTRAAYGTGVTHECRDWVEVREFAARNYEQWKDEGTSFVATEISAVE